MQYLLALLLMLPVLAWGQSRLPACNADGTDLSARRHNCFATLSYPSGAQYAGEFQHDFRHGRGTLTLPGGAQYAGEWRNGNRSGQGIEYRADGIVDRSGRWENGNLVQAFALSPDLFPFNPPAPAVASSAVQTTDASFNLSRLPPCSSRWIKHNCVGEGEISGGVKYVGEFRLGQPSGNGRMSYPTGFVYVGELREGRRNGFGVDYTSRGEVYRSGRWERDVLVEALALDAHRFPFSGQVADAAKTERDRLTAEAELKSQQEIDRRLAAAAREWEQLTAEAEAGRSKRQELEARQLAEARERERERLAAAATERDRLTAEAERKRQQELEQKLLAETRERERLAAEAEAERRKRQELEARQLAEARERERLRTEAEAERKKREEVESRLAAEGRERERLQVAARESERLLAEARERSRQQAQEPPPQRPQASARNERRLALVIGNDGYQSVPKLLNARADASAMARQLEAAGFRVTVRFDLSERAMKDALRTFRTSVEGGDEVVVFFAGHGVQLGAANYLLPVDIRGDSEEQVKDEAIPLQRILDDLSDRKARFSLAIVDACRDNPFKTSGRSIGGRGLAPAAAASGQMVIFSAGAGQQALDRLNDKDSDPNGLFTRIFLKEMARPGVSIDRVVRTVRNEVVQMAKRVGHEQVPALYDQILGDFFFIR